ncbi:MAG TPA: hypothetical protein VI757_03065 [Bacteroidia bacterium]|nr:hypothetical protein [Bacteroidia bacterium]
MKNILLLAAMSCFLIMQTKIVFAKPCEPHLTLTLSPVSVSSGPLTPYNCIYYLFPGDIIVAQFYISGSNCSCGNYAWYLDGNLIQQNTSTINAFLPGTYNFKATCSGFLAPPEVSYVFIIKRPPFQPPPGNWLYIINALSGTYTGHTGIIDNYNAPCSILLTSYAESVTENPMTGFPVDWYLDSVYQFTKGGSVQFDQPGLIYYRVNPAYNLYCISPIQFSTTSSTYNKLHINVLNGTYIQTTHDTVIFNIADNDSLIIKTTETNDCWESRDIGAQWFINDNFYGSTLPGEVISIRQSGLITAIDTINNFISNNKVLLTIIPPTLNMDSSDHLNLRYKIFSIYGQVMEQGDAHDYGILRTKNAQHTLQPGIYFVIYSDALDNRQVLTDKVFVRKQ